MTILNTNLLIKVLCTYYCFKLILYILKISLLKKVGFLLIQRIPEPKKKISKKAINVWRVTDFLQNLIGLIIIGSLLFSFHYFDWVTSVGILLYIFLGILFIIM